jgi:hypothetical protein
MQQLQAKSSKALPPHEAIDEVKHLLPDDWTSGKVTWLLGRMHGRIDFSVGAAANDNDIHCMRMAA